MRSASPPAGTTDRASIAEASPAGERSGRDAVPGSAQDGETPTVDQSREWPFRDTAPRQDPAASPLDPIWGSDPPDAVRWHVDMTTDQEASTSGSPDRITRFRDRRARRCRNGVPIAQRPHRPRRTATPPQRRHRLKRPRPMASRDPRHAVDPVSTGSRQRRESRATRRSPQFPTAGGAEGSSCPSRAAAGSSGARAERRWDSSETAGALDPSGGWFRQVLELRSRVLEVRMPGAADLSWAGTGSRERAGGDPGQPDPSGQQAASDVGWFSTVPGRGQYPGALSERLSAERPGDMQPRPAMEGEPSASAAPAGSQPAGPEMEGPSGPQGPSSTERSGDAAAVPGHHGTGGWGGVRPEVEEPLRAVERGPPANRGPAIAEQRDNPRRNRSCAGRP